MRRAILVAFAAVVAVAGQAVAQQHENVAKGFAADKVYQFNGLDQINMFNLSLNAGIPITPAYHVNGALSYGVTLRYSGNNWAVSAREVQTQDSLGNITTQTYYSTYPYQYSYQNAVNWNAGIGWNVSFGRLIPPGTDPDLAWIYESEDGAKHHFFDTLHEPNTQETTAPGAVDQYGQARVQYTSDNSYLRMVVVTTSNGTYRQVEFPDGTVRRFPYEGGDPTMILDNHGNWVTFTTDYPNDDPAPRVTITDSACPTQSQQACVPRVTRINYKSIWSAPRQRGAAVYFVVKSIEFPRFGSTQPAVYTFHYGVTDAPPQDQQVSYDPAAPDGAARLSRKLPGVGRLDCTVEPTTQAPVLTSVTRPDGSSFEMRYDLGDGGLHWSDGGGDPTEGSTTGPTDVCWNSSGIATAGSIRSASGNLKSLQLPTLGTIEWDYAGIAYPSEGATSHQRIDFDRYDTTFSHEPLARSVGVRERRERAADGTLIGKRTYAARYYKNGTNDAAYALLTTVKEWTNLDTPTPAVLSRKVTYSSVGITSAGLVQTGDYSLPFTRYPFGPGHTAADPEGIGSANARYNETDPVVSVANPDPTSNGTRFLSTKTYDRNGKLAEYSYVGYEGDDATMSEGQQGNRREFSRRTVWNTGNNVFSSDRTSVSSDFDGLGHYRTTEESGTGYEASVSRTSTTAFNRPDADVGGNALDSGTYASTAPSNGGFHMLSPGNGTPSVPPTPWVLGTYTSQRVAEGASSARTLACYDQTTGFLLRKRSLLGESPAGHDLIAVFGTDGLGNVGSEKYYGGDRTTVPTSALCTAGLSTAEYFIAHAYDYGSPARTWYLDDSTSTPAPFWAQNDTIDPTGLVASSADRSDQVTTFNYDAMGRMLTATSPGRVPVTYTYSNAAGTTTPAKVTVVRDNGAGRQPQYEFLFDSFGRVKLERERTATGTFAERSTSRDPLGRTTFVSEWGTPASLKGTTTDYDVFDRPLTITAADGKTASIAYNGKTSLVRMVPVRTNLNTAETLQSTTEVYDVFGRLTRVQEASGTNNAAVDTTYQYDAGDRLVSASTLYDAARSPQTRTFTYDNLGFLRFAASPEIVGSVHNAIYDSRGHARQVIDGISDLTYDYDRWERLTKVSNTGGSEIKAFAFGDANLPLGCTTNCSNFKRGKLVTATRRQSDAALGGEVSVTETYEYARQSGQMSDRQTTVSSTASFTGATFNTYQDYDAFGALSILGYPKCSAPAACVSATPSQPSDVAYYDYANGWMTFIGSNGPAYATLTYQPNGLIATVAHTNGVTETWAPDPNGMPRPCAIFATGLGTQLVSDASAPCGKAIAGTSGVQWSTGAYAFDGAGNIRQIGSKQYLYDGVSRLASEIDSGSTATSSYRNSFDYHYDALGNMTEQAFSRQSVSLVPGGDGAVARSRNPIPVDSATNRLSSAVYDAAGNMTNNGGDAASASAYAWDPVGTMRSLTETGRELHFLYTADDERIATVSLPASSPVPNAKTTWTLRGQSNQVLRTLVDDYSSGAHVWSWSGDEIYRGSSLVADVTPAGRRHFILDHLGSPRLITDESATGNPQTNDFWAFGSGGMTGAGPLQFTGHERDFGNDGYRTLDYMHARYYSAGVGRFLSVDPTSTSADALRPQSWNRYAYTANNPINRFDPDGRDDDLVDNVWNQLLSMLPSKQNPIVIDPQHRPIQTGITILQVASLTVGGEEAASVFSTMRAAAPEAEIVASRSGGALLPAIERGAAAAGSDGPSLTASALKSIQSLGARIQEHVEKLEAYKANPDAFDNKGYLKNAPNAEVRQSIIDSRVRHLEHEIETFRKNIADILKRAVE